MKFQTKILIVIISLLLGGIAFCLFFISSDAVDKEKLEQVDKGMTQVRVRELLGVPHDVRHGAPEQTAFFYGCFRRFKWCSMEAFFGADGRVTGKFHDH